MTDLDDMTREQRQARRRFRDARRNLLAKARTLYETHNAPGMRGYEISTQRLLKASMEFVEAELAAMAAGVTVRGDDG